MGVVTDKYVVSTTGDILAIGTKIRTRSAEPLVITETLYKDPRVEIPTGPPSLIVARVDQPDNKTIKLVFDTVVTFGGFPVTVDHDYTVVRYRLAGHICYLTLDKPIEEIHLDYTYTYTEIPRYPVTLTLPAGFVKVTVRDAGGVETIQYSSPSTPTIEYRYQYILTTLADWPAWAVTYHVTGQLHPEVIIDPEKNVTYVTPPVIDDWYVINATGAEIPPGVDYNGRIVIGANTLSIPCRSDTGSGPFKPNGMAAVTTQDATNKAKFHTTTSDTCTSGGGGVTTIIGTVLGGNSSSTRKAPVKAEDKVDPDVTSVLAYPVPYVNSEGTTSPTDVPVPNDWSKYVLPITWTVGNALPILPDGLCYVKLERPYTAYGASWDAVLPPSIIVATTGAPVPVSAITLGTALTTITIYMNRNISLVTPSTSRPTIVNLSVSTGAEVTPSGITVTANTIVLTVPALDIKYDYTISVPAGYVWTVEPLVNGEPVPPVQNSGFSLPITFKYPGAAVLICANRKGYQLFQAGDLVNLSLEGATIVDSLSAGQIVAEVLSPATNLKQPHIHGYGRFETGASSGTTLP